jgi:hypothetical protein
MRTVVGFALFLVVAAAAPQTPPIPPSVLRSGTDAEQLIRPPPVPRSVMQEPASVSALVEELARKGAPPAPRPRATAPPVDLRGGPPSATAIVDALCPE